MEKQRAGRNRTMTLSDTEKEELRKDLSFLSEKSAVDGAVDKTFNQDLFEALEYLPKHFVDLLIIDPPYNLSKNFASSFNSFKAK